MNNNFNTNIKRAIKVFFNVETILPFLIGSLCLGIFSNAIYDLLKKSIGDDSPQLLKIAASTILIAILAIFILKIKLDRDARPQIDIFTKYKNQPPKHKGLILLVSQEEPCQKAIDFHLSEPDFRLKQCWLICSADSKEKAKTIQNMYVDRIIIEEPKIINDIHDPLEYARVIDLIYTQEIPENWGESDIIADLTGMTANASVGMALLCYSKNRPLQYTPAIVDKTTNRTTGSANPIEINLQ